MKMFKLLSVILFLLHFNLFAAGYSDGSWDYKLPDEIGNLFKTKEKTDRQYGKAGQLLKDERYSYSRNQVNRKLLISSLRSNQRMSFLLSFNSKWIWFFFEPFEESEYNIQFSSDFEQFERINFLNKL